MNITIAGYGFVGEVLEVLLGTENKITIYDPAKGYLTSLVCPTVLLYVLAHHMKDNECDMSNVQNVIRLTPTFPYTY